MQGIGHAVPLSNYYENYGYPVVSGAYSVWISILIMIVLANIYVDLT